MNPPEKPTGAPPQFALMAERREALLAQCPSPVTVNRAAAASFPIHKTTWGAGAERIVLVHGGVQGGLGGGPVTWDGQQALAEHGWRVERVERPGFGRSPSRGVDDMEEDAGWIADMLGDGAALIGHSWGGAAALLAAARRPAAVTALVLVEPALHPLLMGAPEAADAHVARDAGRIPAMILEAKTPAEYGRLFASAMGAVDVGEPNAAAAALQDDTAAASLGCALLRGRMAAPDVLRSALVTVADARIPVLVISGGWSPAFDAIAEMVARVTGGRAERVTSPNHFPQQSAPEKFNEVVDAFLREAPA